MDKKYIWFLLLAQLATVQASAALKVAVSIAPIHSLVQGVMNGLGSPELLVEGNQSPHAGSLQPSILRNLLTADLVVWVGPQLETSLIKAMERVKPSDKLTLLEQSTIELLAARKGGIWKHQGKDGKDQPLKGRKLELQYVDPHIWLSTLNAAAITTAVAERLIALDPDNILKYRDNMDRTLERIEQTRRQIRTMLAPVQDEPWIAFHDAFQYFESEFALDPIGAITVNPALPIGARRIQLLREQVITQNIQCVFTEPQFSLAVIDTVVENTGAKISNLDPLGIMLNPGVDLWFDLLHQLADDLIDCLSNNR